MRMRFAKSRTGDANELSALLKLCDCRASAVTHTCAKTADKLEYSVGKRSLVRNTSLNPFGHELARIFLEIAIL